MDETMFMMLGIGLVVAGSVLRAMMLYSARFMNTEHMPFFGTKGVAAGVGIFSAILGLAGAFFIGRIHGVVIGVASFGAYWVGAALWVPLIDASKK